MKNMKSYNNVEFHTKEEFVKLLYELSDSFKRSSEEWENQTIDSFLDALAGWVTDMDGYYINFGRKIPENIEWNVIADMIIAARDYS